MKKKELPIKRRLQPTFIHFQIKPTSNSEKGKKGYSLISKSNPNSKELATNIG